MGCNCATQEELNKLYEKYSMGYKLGSNANFGDYIKFYIRNLFLIVAIVIASPFLLFYVLVLLFWRKNKVLKVNDFNILRKVNSNVGKQ